MKEERKETEEEEERGRSGKGRKTLTAKSKLQVFTMHPDTGAAFRITQVRGTTVVQPVAGLRATSPQWQAGFLESKRVEFLLEN